MVVEDNVPPTAICKPITVYLNNSGNVSIANDSVDGGSVDSCGGLTFSTSQINFDCADEVNSPVEVTLTVTDANSNTSTCTAQVTVIDTIPPSANCQDITIQLDASGTAMIDGSDIDNGSSDVCSMVTLDVSPDGFTCDSVGANTVILSVTDEDNNTSTCDATVTVEDNVDPVAVCQDITVYLDTFGIAVILGEALDNGSSDACGIDSLNSSIDTVDCSDVGTLQVTLTVVDSNNNSSNCLSTVTVEDTIPPTAVCQDVTVELNASGNGLVNTIDVDAGSVDSCGIAGATVMPNTFDCDDIFAPVTVVLTVQDDNANQDTCQAKVTVVDSIDPTVVCPPNTILNTDPGECGATNNLMPTPDDNCGSVGLNLTFDPDTSLLLPVGVDTSHGYCYRYQWKYRDMYI